MITATKAFEQLIESANTKYIVFHIIICLIKEMIDRMRKYLMKIFWEFLVKKGKVTIFELDYKSFSTGKSDIKDNKERLFLCEVFREKKKRINISCPFNYTGGKFKLLDQIQPLLNEKEVFLDLFAGGGNVGINSSSSKVIFNDSNENW